MIVEPDFADHWKTRMLVDLLDKDEAAPVYLLRLWAHCQTRRQVRFENLPPMALKALCRYPGHPTKLEASLVSSGFVSRDGVGVLTVLKWDEYNAALVANWQNGVKGGRPPKHNPPETQEKPTGNPKSNWVMSGVTDGLDRKGFDQKGKEKTEDPPNPPRGGGTPAGDVAIPDCLKTQAFITAWDEWAQHRREKRARLTTAAAKRQLAKFAEWGEQRAIAAIHHSVQNGWTGVFEPDRAGSANQRESDGERTLRILRERQTQGGAA